MTAVRSAFAVFVVTVLMTMRQCTLPCCLPKSIKSKQDQLIYRHNMDSRHIIWAAACLTTAARFAAAGRLDMHLSAVHMLLGCSTADHSCMHPWACNRQQCLCCLGCIAAKRITSTPR